MKPNTILDNISKAISRNDPYAEVFLFHGHGHHPYLQTSLKHHKPGFPACVNI